MASLTDTLGSVASGFGTTLEVVIIISIVLFVIAVILSIFAFYFWNKKRYNLRIEIKKVRSDGRFVSAEWGKGIFNAKRGVVYIKRNKITKTTPMKVFDIRRYLQGDDILSVEQLGPEDFRPILPDSFTGHVVEYEDEKTGKIVTARESIMNIRVDTGLNKAWKSSFESASKNAYSLRTFMQQFQVPISIAIVVISVFVGIAILWTKIGSMCGGS